MLTFGNGRVVLPIKNSVKRHLRNSLKKGKGTKQSAGSQDSDSSDSFPATKADGTNDVSGALTTYTSPPSPEYSTRCANELPWPYFPPTLVDGDGDGDGGEWVCVDEDKDPNLNPFSLYDGFVFGSVPSGDEVQAALTSLQGVLGQAASANGVNESDADLEEGTDDESNKTDSSSVTPIGSISDWIEPSMQLCYSNNSGTLQQRRGYDIVYDALYMLQQEPMVQKMVASLSSDKAVWEAVLNNEVVKEIRESLKAVVVSSSASSEASESKSANFLRSFIDNLKAKIEGLVSALRMLMISLIHHEKSDQGARQSSNGVEGTLRVSFTLTIIVFLIVVLKRMNK